MKMSSREIILAWLTCLAIIGGVTFWFIEPRLRTLRDMSRRITIAERKIERDQNLLNTRQEWNQRLTELRKTLTKYPQDKDLTAEYLKLIERLAKENNLTLVQRRPDKEKTQGGLYELSINCTWEGNLEAIVRFLYTLEQQDVSMTIEELTISTISGKNDQLRGSFSLICAYTREDSVAE